MDTRDGESSPWRREKTRPPAPAASLSCAAFLSLLTGRKNSAVSPSSSSLLASTSSPGVQTHCRAAAFSRRMRWLLVCLVLAHLCSENTQSLRDLSPGASPGKASLSPSLLAAEAGKLDISPPKPQGNPVQMGAPTHPLFGAGKQGKDLPPAVADSPPPPAPPVLPPVSPEASDAAADVQRRVPGSVGESPGGEEQGEAQREGGHHSGDDTNETAKMEETVSPDPVHNEERRDSGSPETAGEGENVPVSGKSAIEGEHKEEAPSQGLSPESDRASDTHAAGDRNLAPAPPASEKEATDDAVTRHAEKRGVDTPPLTQERDASQAEESRAEDNKVPAPSGQSERVSDSRRRVQRVAGNGASPSSSNGEAAEGNGSPPAAAVPADARIGRSEQVRPAGAPPHHEAAAKKREGGRRGSRGPGFGRQFTENAAQNDPTNQKQGYPTPNPGVHTPSSGVHTPNSGVPTPIAGVGTPQGYPVPPQVGQEAGFGHPDAPSSTAPAPYYANQDAYVQRQGDVAVPSHGTPPGYTYGYASEPAAAYASEPVQVYGDGERAPPQGVSTQAEARRDPVRPSALPHWEGDAFASSAHNAEEGVHSPRSASVNGIETREEATWSVPPSAYAPRAGRSESHAVGNCRDPELLVPTLEEHCDAWCTTEALKHWEGSRPVWASLHLNPIPSFFSDLRTGVFVLLYRHRDSFFAAKAHLEEEAQALGDFLAEKNREFRQAHPLVWLTLCWLLGVLVLSRLLTGHCVPAPLLCCLGGANGWCARRRRLKEEQRSREEVAQAVVDSLLKNQQVKWLLNQTKKTSFICEKLKGSVVAVQRTETEEKLTMTRGDEARDARDSAELARAVAALQRDQEELKLLLRTLQEQQQAERESRQTQLERILAETKKQFDSATLQQAQYSLTFLQALGRIRCAVDPTYSSEDKEQLEALIERDAAAIREFFSEECRDEVNDTYELPDASPARNSFAEETFSHLMRTGMSPRGLTFAGNSFGFSARSRNGEEERDKESSPSTSPPREAADCPAAREDASRQATGEQHVEEDAKPSAADVDESRRSSAITRQEGPRGVVPPNLFDVTPAVAASGFAPPAVVNFPSASSSLGSHSPSSQPPPVPPSGPASCSAAPFEESLASPPEGDGVSAAVHPRSPLPPQGLRDPFASPLPPSADIEGGSGGPAHRLRSSSIGSVASLGQGVASPTTLTSNGVYGQAPPAGLSASLGNAAPSEGAAGRFVGSRGGAGGVEATRGAPPGTAGASSEPAQRPASGTSHLHVTGAGDENASSLECPTRPPTGGLVSSRPPSAEEPSSGRPLMNGTAPMPPAGLKPHDPLPPQTAAGLRPAGRILRERREPPKVQAATNPFGIPPPPSAPLSSGMDF
ncbi:hypothetical protein TGVAND_221870 [Toxoplasma gondii VAND]|uniref:Uncharacterized protein n=1 Tax=Toxoplasma gondii VAND TaxID=933077 RepID=A0A086PTH8_TOXGO|nr:hypothetical protein TGVAND_221870 [Toxoplasma gondii VAND]